MNEQQVDRIAAVAEKLAPDEPDFRNRRLFSEGEFYLYEKNDKYEDQRKELDQRRQKAIQEILAAGGVQAVLNFADAVESPWRVGIAFGTVAEKEADGLVLPELLETENRSLAQFAGGVVWGRFRYSGMGMGA